MEDAKKIIENQGRCEQLRMNLIDIIDGVR